MARRSAFPNQSTSFRSSMRLHVTRGEAFEVIPAIVVVYEYVQYMYICRTWARRVLLGLLVRLCLLIPAWTVHLLLLSWQRLCEQLITERRHVLVHVVRGPLGCVQVSLQCVFQYE